MIQTDQGRVRNSLSSHSQSVTRLSLKTINRPALWIQNIPKGTAPIIHPGQGWWSQALAMPRWLTPLPFCPLKTVWQTEPSVAQFGSYLELYWCFSKLNQDSLQSRCCTLASSWYITPQIFLTYSSYCSPDLISVGVIWFISTSPYYVGIAL